jgi:hypothetical protein
LAITRLSSSIKLGPYTVRLLEKPGPGCSLYAVYLGSTKIGQCISLPGESDCQWLERQMREQTGYAYSTTPLPHRWAQRKARSRRGRPRNSETIRDIAKELAGG